MHIFGDVDVVMRKVMKMIKYCPIRYSYSLGTLGYEGMSRTELRRNRGEDLRRAGGGAEEGY